MGVFGVVFYVFMVAICSPQTWRSRLPALHRARLMVAICSPQTWRSWLPTLHRARLAAAVIGMGLCST